MSDDVQRWARELIEQNRAGSDFEAPWGETPELSDAYQVQDAVFAGLAEQRGDVGGYKVAVTAAPMQEALGLTEPLGGVVHRGQLRADGAVLSMSEFHSPAIECEVAIRLGTDVPVGDGPFDQHSIAAFVGEVMASFEVVDTRGADLGGIGAAGLVADRCLSEGAVLGSPVGDGAALDLAVCPVELVWNGEVTDTSVTGAAMGNPLNGLAWVANHLAGRGRSLRAGDVVLTGSAFAPKPIAAGDRVEYRIEGLGSVTVGVAD